MAMEIRKPSCLATFCDCDNFVGVNVESLHVNNDTFSFGKDDDFTFVTHLSDRNERIVEVGDV